MCTRISHRTLNFKSRTGTTPHRHSPFPPPPLRNNIIHPTNTYKVTQIKQIKKKISLTFPIIIHQFIIHPPRNLSAPSLPCLDAAETPTKYMWLRCLSSPSGSCQVDTAYFYLPNRGILISPHQNLPSFDSLPRSSFPAGSGYLEYDAL